MVTANLTAAEMERWTQWKAATDAVWAEVVCELADATGLSAADFSVLTRVVELGGGALRQQVLADNLRWQRARLSRQVTRMVDRGLLERTTAGAVVMVIATPDGRRSVTKARRAHARAVRRALLSVAPSEAEGFWDTVGHLATGTASPVGE